MLEPKFRNGLLLCPNCSFDHMHRVRTDIYSRPEDRKDSQLVSVANPDNEMMGDASIRIMSTASECHNPSPRRHGVRHFYCCEGCHVTSLLVQAQHKGTEYLYWEGIYTPPLEAA
jgi:hypothetical protein